MHLLIIIMLALFLIQLPIVRWLLAVAIVGYCGFWVLFFIAIMVDVAKQQPEHHRGAQPVAVGAPAPPTSLPPLLPPISPYHPGDASVPGAVRVGAIIQRQPGRWYRKIAVGPDSEPGNWEELK